MTIPIIAKFQKAFVGTTGLMDAADVDNNDAVQTGVVSGAANLQIALNRLDGTGIGAAIFTFSGPFSATSSNINDWFDGRQQTRLRCISNGGISPVTFDLPGELALNAAFDQLVTDGLPEVLRFIIEYTGTSATSLVIRPRSSPSPRIMGTTNVIVPSGVAATLEITRSSGTITDYIFTSRGGIGDTNGGATDSIKLINPASAVWDASASGTLPSNAVVKGNAYKVINAPADGSGRFGEVMSDGDWVIWEGETFTTWATEPHAWFVIPAHEVRRISALESDFLNTVQQSPASGRNTINRGVDYADIASEIRLKIYTTQADYDAADLNITGDIDEYTDTSNRIGYLAIRLTGVRSSLLSVLPTLWVYAEDSGGDFHRLLNLADDFDFQGDFGGESDYLARSTINYTANDALRIYVTITENRYNSPDLDINESNLSADVQAKLNRTDGGGTVDEQRLQAVESKVAALFPLTPDVGKLVSFSGIYTPDAATEAVNITEGYSLIADYRSDADRYESAGVTYDASGTDVVRYTGLSNNLHRMFGFKVTTPANEVLMWLVDDSTLIPFVDITAAGNIRINDYTPATTEDRAVSDQLHSLTKTSGDEYLSQSTTSISTFTVTAFPANATNTSRRMQIGIDVALNGVDTQAEHLQNIDLPANNVAQSRRTFNASIPLGPLYGNRTVAVTVGYELRVSGSDLLIDLTLIDAPSDVTIRAIDVYVFLSYTASASVARVDNFVAFQDASGAFTFSGETDFIVSLQPNVFDNSSRAVAGAISSTGTVTLFNDRNVPNPAHGFASVEIPDDIDFVTALPDHFFIHSDIGALLLRRGTKWAYGLALLSEVTEQQIDKAIDFTSGFVLTAPNGTRYTVSVDDTGSLKTDVTT